MYLPGHVGLALLAAAGVVVVAGPGRRRGGVGTVVLVALATAPDVDLYLAGVPHRGITHTVWAGLVVGGVLSVAGWRVSLHYGGCALSDARFCLTLGVTSVLTHLVGDVVTPMGIRPFYPLVDTTRTFDLVAARNPDANLALLLTGLLAFALVAWPHLPRGHTTWVRTRTRTRTAGTRLVRGTSRFRSRPRRVLGSLVAPVRRRRN